VTNRTKPESSLQNGGTPGKRSVHAQVIAGSALGTKAWPSQQLRHRATAMLLLGFTQPRHSLLQLPTCGPASSHLPTRLAYRHAPGTPTPEELLKIAIEMGHKGTAIRLARHFQECSAVLNYQELLAARIREMACNYFGYCSTRRAARRLWNQVETGVIDSSSRDEPDFVLSPSAIEDMIFLFKKVGIRSKDQLQQLVADPDAGQA